MLPLSVQKDYRRLVAGDDFLEFGLQKIPDIFSQRPALIQRIPPLVEGIVDSHLQAFGGAGGLEFTDHIPLGAPVEGIPMIPEF